MNIIEVGCASALEVIIRAVVATCSYKTLNK